MITRIKCITGQFTICNLINEFALIISAVGSLELLKLKYCLENVIEIYIEIKKKLTSLESLKIELNPMDKYKKSSGNRHRQSM